MKHKYALGRGTRSAYYSYNSQSRKEYYIAKADARNYEDLLDRISNVGEDVNYYYYTDKHIKPFSVPFGSSIKVAKKILGKPNYILEFPKDDKLTILFFKKRVDTYKYILQLHFFEGQLVYAMNHVYESLPLKNFHMLEMTKLLLYKYTNNSHSDLSSSNITLVDSKNNRITIIDSLEYNIRYSTGNEFVGARIKQLIEIKNNNSIKSKLHQKVAMLNFL